MHTSAKQRSCRNAHETQDTQAKHEAKAPPDEVTAHAHAQPRRSASSFRGPSTGHKPPRPIACCWPAVGSPVPSKFASKRGAVARPRRAPAGRRGKPMCGSPHGQARAAAYGSPMHLAGTKCHAHLPPEFPMPIQAAPIATSHQHQAALFTGAARRPKAQ